MDTLDYQRLQTWGAKGVGGSKIQTLLLAYDWLHRHGVVRFIDYSDFYSKSAQQSTLQKNREIVEALPESAQHRSAVHGAAAWVDYGRGSHLEAVCTSLGEEKSRFRAAQKTDKKRHRSLERGSLSPMSWNERVLNRYLAALHVRHYADSVLELDVKGVIGQGESAGIRGLVTAAEDHAPSKAAHIRNLEPRNFLFEFPSEDVAPTRELLNTIGGIATEIAGVQHEDWIMVGPSLAIPQYSSVFNLDEIRRQAKNGLSKDEIAPEVTQILEMLDHRSTNGDSSQKLQYEADWVAEQHSYPTSGSTVQSTGLTEIADYAMNLAEHSSELRYMVEQGEVSQTAALIGASIASDPTVTDDLNAIYLRGEDVISRLDPPMVSDDRLKAARRRVGAWDKHPDWYQDPNRAR